MAFAPNLARKWFENLSVEELEAKYEELKQNYCFNTKEEQIDHIIKNYLNASKRANDNSVRVALEELLKEKTGKDYQIEPKRFEITLEDVINFVTNPNTDPIWTKALTDFFQKLDEVSNEEKTKFLIELVQDKDSFNVFTKEIIRTQDAKEIYNRYQKIARDYIIRNSVKS